MLASILAPAAKASARWRNISACARISATNTKRCPKEKEKESYTSRSRREGNHYDIKVCLDTAVEVWRRRFEVFLQSLSPGHAANSDGPRPRGLYCRG